LRWRKVVFDAGPISDCASRIYLRYILSLATREWVPDCLVWV